MKHFFWCYIGRYDILSQQIIQIQDYHRKTYCNFNVTLHSRKEKHFLSYKVANNHYKVVFSKFLYLIANWTSYSKPIEEALTILKSPLKLLITSSYNGQQLVLLENQIIFLKVPYAPWLPWQQTCILNFNILMQHQTFRFMVFLQIYPSSRITKIILIFCFNNLFEVLKEFFGAIGVMINV